MLVCVSLRRQLPEREWGRWGRGEETKRSVSRWEEAMRAEKGQSYSMARRERREHTVVYEYA